MKLRGLIFVLTFSTIFFGAFSAQTLSGVVISNNGSPIENASVYSRKIESGTTTDAQGKFELEIHTTEEIIIYVASIGFKTLEISVLDLSEFLKITLEEDVYNLFEVVVEGDGDDSGHLCLVKIASMEAQQLDRSSSPSRIIALAKEPGVEMITSGGGVVIPVIRGLSGMRIATLYRGARIESQAWGADHGIYLPEQGVDRVEIIKGPNAIAIGSDAIGGVLNFLPENPLSEIGRESSLSIRGFTSSKGLNSSFITKKRSRHAHHTFSGGINNHGNYYLPDGSEVENSAYNQFFAQGVFGYIKNWGLIDGAYSSSYNKAEMIGSEGWQQSGDHLMTTSATFIKLGWKFKPSISYQLNHRKEFESTISEETGELIDIADLDMSLRTLRYNFIASKSSKDNYYISLGSQGQVSTNTNSDDLVSLFIPDARCMGLGFFTNSSWSTGNLKLQAAIRGDVVEIVATEAKQFGYLSHSIGFKYKVSPTANITASRSVGTRAPGLSELWSDGIHHGTYRYEIGNSSLTPEKSRNLEISYTTEGTQIQAEFNLFLNNIKDYIQLNPTGEEIDGYSVFEYFNSDATLRGGEVGAVYSPSFIRDLKIKASISYVDGFDVDTQDALMMIPPLSFNSALMYQKSSMGSLEDVFAILSFDALSEYSTVHVSCGFSVRSKLDFSISVRNLFNVEYIPELSLLKNIGIAEPGRNVSVKAAVRF